MGDLRIFDVEQIKTKFNLNVFIETGTLHGDTIEWLHPSFEELHSIELDTELYEKAALRFNGNTKVTIHHGNSTDVLEKILPDIKKSALFWLDAHFPGADVHKVSYDNEKNEDIRVPLHCELEEISKRKYTYKDVIIIDDVWLYEDGNYEWGTFDLHSQKCNLKVTRSQLVSRNSSFIYETFKDTHKAQKFNNHQGYIVLTPVEKE